MAKNGLELNSNIDFRKNQFSRKTILKLILDFIAKKIG
jgi:hypothetical protein